MHGWLAGALIPPPPAAPGTVAPAAASTELWHRPVPAPTVGTALLGK